MGPKKTSEIRNGSGFLKGFDMLQKTNVRKKTIPALIIVHLFVFSGHESLAVPFDKKLHHGNQSAERGFFSGNNVEGMAANQRAFLSLKDNTDWSRIDELFSEWDKPGSPGCVLGVIHRGELIYQRGYGEANLDYGVPITPETVFYIASISKQFAAACVAIMTEKGLIDLDDDIRKYIPEMPDYGEPVRIRHLVYHISGVRDLFQILNFAEINRANVVSLNDKLELISRQSDLNFVPGDEFLYSNGGYTLIAVLVERVTGKSFREFAHENIFQPLGMENSHFHDNRQEIVKNRAVSYQKHQDEFIISYHGNYQGVGADGLYTTLGDMLIWDQNLYNNRLDHSPELSRIMHERGRLNSGEMIDYAFGLRIGDHRGLITVGHTGSLMGFTSSYLRIPDQEFSVILFSNLGSINPRILSARVVDICLEELFVEKTRPYRGTYINHDHDAKCIIESDGSRLILTRPLPPSGEMTHTGAGKFSIGGWSLEFFRDEKGDVAGFRVDTRGARNVRYEKK